MSFLKASYRSVQYEYHGDTQSGRNNYTLGNIREQIVPHQCRCLIARYLNFGPRIIIAIGQAEQHLWRATIGSTTCVELLCIYHDVEHGCKCRNCDQSSGEIPPTIAAMQFSAKGAIDGIAGNWNKDAQEYGNGAKRDQS